MNISAPLPNSLAGRDIAHVLHPYTNLVRHETAGPLVIERGKGIVRNGGRWAVVSSIDEIKSCVAAWRANGADIELVPVRGVIL